ncbi:MAG: hypothetical protein ACYC96_08125 [Fimbriimonadaceae bacterium]
MTERDIRDAVARGQGRAIQYLRSHSDQANFDLVFDLCIRNQEFDRYFEDRIDYMWRLALTLPRPFELVAPLGERLFAARVGRDRMQIREILARFRAAGSTDAREQLVTDFHRFRLKERPCADAVSLLGYEGLELVVVHASRLKGREVRRAYDDAVRAFGQARVDRLFRQIASTNAEVQRSLNGEKAVHAPSADATTSDEWLKQLRSGERVSPRFFRLATDADWAAVATIAMLTDEEAVLRSAWELFRNRRTRRSPSWIRDRPWPLDPAAALERALADPCARRRRLRLLLLSRTRYGPLRDWSLDQISNPRSLRENEVAFDLLEVNALRRDRPALARALRGLKRQRDAFHAAGISVLHLRVRPSTELLHVIYEFGYCDFCRNRAIEALAKRQAVTLVQIEECLDDSSSDTRQWANRTIVRRRKDSGGALTQLSTHS